MTSASDEKCWPFNCFFSRVGLRSYQHPCIIQLLWFKPADAHSINLYRDKLESFSVVYIYCLTILLHLFYKPFFDILEVVNLFCLFCVCVLWTVQLSIILGNDQLDTQLLYFTIRLLWSSTCFEHCMLIIRRLNCTNAASGIVTLKISEWSKITGVNLRQ